MDLATLIKYYFKVQFNFVDVFNFPQTTIQDRMIITTDNQK